MSCNDHDKMNPVAHALYHVKEWDKKMAKKIQDKFNLTDYQMLCIASYESTAYSQISK